MKTSLLLHIKFCLATIGVGVFGAMASAVAPFYFRTKRKEYIMNTAAKVIIIIKLVIGIIFAVIFLILAFYSPIILIRLLFLIPPAIISINAINQLDEYEKPSIAISVLTLLFVSPLAGILMLCIPEQYECNDLKYKGNSLICEKCGKYNVGAKYQKVNTYLGERFLNICPKCKTNIDLDIYNKNKKSNPVDFLPKFDDYRRMSRSIDNYCDQCGNFDEKSKYYSLKFGDSISRRYLCPRCKATYDAIYNNSETPTA